MIFADLNYDAEGKLVAEAAETIIANLGPNWDRLTSVVIKNGMVSYVVKAEQIRQHLRNYAYEISRATDLAVDPGSALAWLLAKLVEEKMLTHKCAAYELAQTWDINIAARVQANSTPQEGAAQLNANRKRAEATVTLALGVDLQKMIRLKISELEQHFKPTTEKVKLEKLPHRRLNIDP